MTITIKLKTDNAAFEEDYRGSVNALVQDAARRIANGDRAFTVCDSNGNTVGTVKVTGR